MILLVRLINIFALYSHTKHSENTQFFACSKMTSLSEKDNNWLFYVCPINYVCKWFFFKFPCNITKNVNTVYHTATYLHSPEVALKPKVHLTCRGVRITAECYENENILEVSGQLRAGRHAIHLHFVCACVSEREGAREKERD